MRDWLCLCIWPRRQNFILEETRNIWQLLLLQIISERKYQTLFTLCFNAKKIISFNVLIYVESKFPGSKVKSSSNLISITWLSLSLQLHKVISSPFYACISLDINLDLLENGPNSTLECADDIVNWSRIDNGFSLLESRGNILIRPSYLSSAVLCRNPGALFRQDLFFKQRLAAYYPMPCDSEGTENSFLPVPFPGASHWNPWSFQWMERITDKHINEYQEPSLLQLSGLLALQTSSCAFAVSAQSEGREWALMKAIRSWNSRNLVGRYPGPAVSLKVRWSVAGSRAGALASLLPGRENSIDIS